MSYLSTGLTPQPNPNPGVLSLILLLLPGPATQVLCVGRASLCGALQLPHCCSVTRNTPSSLMPRWTVADSLRGDTWLFPAILQVTPEYELLPCPALGESKPCCRATERLRPQSHNQHVLGKPTGWSSLRWPSLENSSTESSECAACLEADGKETSCY